MADDLTLPADDLPEVKLAPVEDTYSEDHLAVVDAARDLTDIPFGYVRSERDPRAWQYAQAAQHSLDEQGMVSVGSDPLTPVVRTAAKVKDRDISLAKRTGAVRDQGLTPRCVCYSGASLRVLQERADHKRTFEPDEDLWYAETKQADPWGPGTDGTGIEFACEVARTTGVVMDDPRSKKDDAEPRRFKIGAYAEVKTVEEFLDALRYTPVWFGNDVDTGIFTPQLVTSGPAKGDYVIAPPSGRSAGGHAMLAVGYWLSMGWILVKQSWGEAYGGVKGLGGGYFWMPLSHLTDPRYRWDAWVVTDADDDFLRRAT